MSQNQNNSLPISNNNSNTDPFSCLNNDPFQTSTNQSTPVSQQQAPGFIPQNLYTFNANNISNQAIQQPFPQVQQMQYPQQSPFLSQNLPSPFIQQNPLGFGAQNNSNLTFQQPFVQLPQMQFQPQNNYQNLNQPQNPFNNYGVQSDPLKTYEKERLAEDKVEQIPIVKNLDLIPDFDFEKDFQLEVQAPYQFYKLTQESQTIPIKISLQTVSSSMDVEKDLLTRSNIDLICVVDISGSMQGEKISLVKKTLKYITSILTENDRLSLVVFDDHGEELITLKRISEANHKMFDEIFDSLRERGGTCINAGVNKALNIIKSRKFKNEITSIFLLSDGVDNIRSQALGVIQKTVQSQNIAENFTINTFGFGKDHDANLMREIAKNNGGNFYFIDNLESIDECFVDAMGLLFSVILKDVEIIVKVNNQAPLSDMRVKKTYGDMWSYDETKGNKITMKIFTKGLKKDYICEVNLPPCKKELQDEEKYRMLLTVTLSGNSIKNQSIIKKYDLFLNVLNNADQIQGPNELNIDVVVNHLRVKGAEKIETAKCLAEKKQFEQAQKELDSIKKELEECICKDHPSLVILKADIEKSKTFCQAHSFSNAGLSYMTTFSNNNMYQQSSPMTIIGNINNLYATPMQAMMSNTLMNAKPKK